MASRAWVVPFLGSLLLMSGIARADAPPPLPPPAPPPPTSGTSEPASTPPPVTRPRQDRDRDRDKDRDRDRDREDREDVQLGEDGAPAARKGFQIGVRPGISVPFGSSAKDQKMSDGPSAQFTLNADIGAKIIPQLFVGGYIGFGLGGVAGKTSDACDKANISCASATIRLGVEAQYHILPARKMNPWVGLGIGWEFTSIGGGDGNQRASTTVNGVELAHFMGGLDFRLSRVVGVGPFLDLSLGRYSNSSSDTGNTTVSTDIKDKAVHGWFTLGARVLFFP